ncbi:Uncharacterised protein [Klebsiella pneumoniae]|nr:Uncharacterised protein [Klebsiella pneumoniae]
MWEGDQLFAGPTLHRLPAVHDVDFIRPFAEHLQVMADQQDGGVVVLVEPRQQANNLRLGGRLHGVGRLVGNQQTRLVGQGDGGPAGDTLNQLLADALRGIEARLGLLKNHRHVMADQLPALAVRQSQQVNVIEAHAVGRDPPVVFGHAADSFGNKAFPGAGFPHQAADFAFGQRQADAIDGFYPAFAGFKFNG